MGRQGAVAGIVVALLLVVSTVALRGRLPGAGPVPPVDPSDGQASTAFVTGLVVAAVAVTALAVITRWRRVGSAASSTADRSDWSRGNWERPSKRVVVIALVIAVVWLLAVAWLSRLGGGGVGPDGMGVRTPDDSVPDTSTTTALPPARPPPTPSDSSSNLLVYLAAATIVFLLVVVVASVHAARTRRRQGAWAPMARNDLENTKSAVASETLARAAEVGLAEVNDATRDPRAAIIACYVAMERELARVPDAVPQDCDTASEVLERAVQRHALGPDSATKLVELFDEARFSPHVMDEGHREVAVQVLQRVLGELRSLA